MKTMAPDAPTSHTSARCKASTPGAAVIDGSEFSAVAAYAITHSYNYATQPARNACRTGRLGFLFEDDLFGNPVPTFPDHALVSVLVLRDQRQRRLEQNEEIEQHRPVLDVIEIELDALLDLLVGVDFAAPAIDLRPAGNAGLDAVTREIAIHGLVEQPALQLALHGVRAGADQRQIALEHDVEELRQLVEAGSADETADAGDAGIVLGHDLCGHRIGLMMVQRAKLENVDGVLVKAATL